MKIAHLVVLLSPTTIITVSTTAFCRRPRCRTSITITTSTFATTTTNTMSSTNPSSNNNNNNDDAVPKLLQPLPRVDSVERVASTKWLALNTMNWTDKDGIARKWDVASRTTKKDPNSADAVCIIPMLRHGDGGKVETLLVEQFRPPVRQTTIEFPAGLIDDGETPEQAALRELREETGYVGEACRVVPTAASRPVCMSPGLTDETIQVVIVEVDTSNPYNINPKPELDDGEHVTVRRVGLDEGFKKVLDNNNNDNPSSSSSPMPLMGLYLFAIGLDMGRQQQQQQDSSSSSK